MNKEDIPRKFWEFKTALANRRRNVTIQKKRLGKYRHSLLEARNLKRMYGDLLHCSICGEDRAIELCHIVPVRMNGDGSVFNLLVLCPTHHKVYDDSLLSDMEVALIRDKVVLGLKYHCLNMSVAA